MDAVAQAGVIFAAGHKPTLPACHWSSSKSMVTDGRLGTILHVGKAYMSGHVGNRYKPDMWRVDPSESPAGGMAGSGIHVIDAMIHLCGPISAVEAQSFRIINKVDMDGHHFHPVPGFLRPGCSGYLVALIATAPISSASRSSATRAGPSCGVKPRWSSSRSRAFARFGPFPPSRLSFGRLRRLPPPSALAPHIQYLPPMSSAVVAAFEAVALSAADHRRIEI